MKYRWEVLWSDGTRDTAVYAVERKLAEQAVARWIEQGTAYSLNGRKPEGVWFIPEQG